MSVSDGKKAKRPLLVIVGPTAVGKTAISVRLAQKFEGEVVSADSRLFYRRLDIGTDKPSMALRASIPHHLVDIREPEQTLSLGQYQRLAYAAIADIHRHRQIPLLVGGTGQYIRAVVEGWRIPAVRPSEVLRKALADLGDVELARWLRFLDPLSAERIDPRNVRRVIRALEVTLITGRPISQLQHKDPPNYDVKTIALLCDREVLYQLIDARVERMMASGLLDEVVALRDQGYARDLPALSGLGYRQLWAYLEGETTLEAAVQRIKFETHRFARQQFTWFRERDPEISWFDVQVKGWAQALEQHVEDWLTGLEIFLEAGS